MAVPTLTNLTLHERDILLAILEFLEHRGFHISLIALERETGLINGDWSEDVLFLRQLIIDGQWDNVLDFVEPLRDSPDFDQRGFCYIITKYKFFELLCVKQEPGMLQDNDFVVEEIVECLKDLEQIAPSPEEYRHLCALLTLPNLTDHVDFKGWNPSAARIEAFKKVYPLVADLLSAISLKKDDRPTSHASNDRLIQLVAKGLFYETCVDFCQIQALGGPKAAERNFPQFGSVLAKRMPLSATDLSLISWLDVLGNEQFTTPFAQRNLDFHLERLRKPKLEAQWSEQILAAPIRPGGFPHALVPNSKPKFAEKMSQSMVLPPMSSSFAMIESRVVGTKIRPPPNSSPMSRSTAASIGSFVIAAGTQPNELMEQSAVISDMFERSELTKQSRPQATTGSSSSATSTSSLPVQLAQELNQSRRELDAITRRIQPPSSLQISTLPAVPEMQTPVSPSKSTEETKTPDDVMTRSRLFQEFTSRKRLNENHQSIPPPVIPSSLRPQSYGLQSQQIYQPQNPQIYPTNIPPVQMRPMSTMLPGQIPPQPSYYPTPVPRPISYNPPPAPIQPLPVPSTQSLPVQFVPLCRYEDENAVRTVAFHPSGSYFAIGTNSKQLLVCKYKSSNSVNLQKPPPRPEVSLWRKQQHRGSVYCCGFNSTGDLLATGSNDKTIRLMSFNASDCRIGAETELTNVHDGTVRDLIFLDESRQGSVLVSGGAGNCQICLTDCATTKTFKNLSGHTGPILGLHSWATGTSFVSCSQDKTVRFWDVRASAAVNVIMPNMKTSNSPVTSVCVDSSARLLVSGHEDASIALHDLTGGRIIQVFRPHGDEVRTVRFSNAAYYLLSGSYDNRIVITDMRGDLMAPLSYLPVAEHSDKIIQCRFHPQDFSFISSSADRSAILWSLPPQQQS
ncbi:hypothetical protein M3Y95_00717700 [Aphelenchoides besseyi]|nr:hypothetical protein M3Y95_00717700 [Aphelenchoides besseyi]